MIMAKEPIQTDSPTLKRGNVACCAKLQQLLASNLDFHDERNSHASHNFHSFPAKFPP